MEFLSQSIWLVPLFPFLASILPGSGSLLFPNYIRSFRRVSSFVSISFLTLAMLISFHSLWQQVMVSPIHRCLWSRVIYENIILEIGYLNDPLASLMLVLVTTIGVTVMIYSNSYMYHDEGYIRFFCYLSLFTASMLGLVLSPNLIQIYIFWELVGTCSYLLIGFWFTRPSAANACQKAFVTNRIGDFGLLLGISGFYWITGSFEFQNLSERFFELLVHNQIGLFPASLCGILLFLGPVAKSAQFPLHIWLPDAMEGPTPISALIHAATMVAAGIYLVARMLPLFEMLPPVTNTISWVGAITALLGASIALAQKDLKRGLAYSTMSQLGYMVLGLGIGSYKAGLFHLITHAYSKALLFLGSGSVIHSMEPIVGYHPNRSQNMGLMGGLGKYMPVTAITFPSGTLSLCGIPPFACFWSKDEILVDSWLHFPPLGFIASFTAGSTAFYMSRIYLLTFLGNFRGYSRRESAGYSSLIPIWGDFPSHRNRMDKFSDGIGKSVCIPYPKESDNIMLFSLVLLAIPTLFIGFVGVSLSQERIDSLSHWLHLSINSFNNYSENFVVSLPNAIPSVVIALSGISIGYSLYGSNTRIGQGSDLEIIDYASKYVSLFLSNWSHHRGYIDGFYDLVFTKGLRFSARFLSFVDQWIIDGVVNGTGILSSFGGEGLKYTGGGRISSYLSLLVSCMFLSLPYSYII
nr:NADH-plastoquinone oxidoreductase subunit 5 [Pellia epiphylla]WIA68379.1 NADH-plastoquinone oxidoreductase subunit 5 [Pellia epiphylla]